MALKKCVTNNVQNDGPWFIQSSGIQACVASINREWA